MTSRHNLKIGCVSGYCECGSTAISGMGMCRDCFMEANPDLAQHYANNPTKRVVMTSVNTAAKQITTVDTDWAAFCKRVDETDCTSQWADRGADHD